MRKVLISFALASATLAAATPAMAQPWRPGPSVQREIQRDINQLDRRIIRAQERRTISAREANGLRRNALQIRRTYAQYARNGLNRAEVRDLQNRVNQVQVRLRLERRDWDGRRG